MNLKKYSWLAALPMIFTACQEDMLVENLQQGITTLTASMDKAPSDSRAQIVLDGSNTAKEIFHWNAGDKFSLFQFGDESNAWTEQVSEFLLLKEHTTLLMLRMVMQLLKARSVRCSSQQ